MVRADGATPPTRVLVIEPHPDGREALCDLLTLWGYAVDDAASGAEGLAAAMDFRPDVAIIALGLAGMDGCDVAKVLRARGDCPVLIAYTGWGRPADRQHAMGAGFDLFLLKPAGIEELKSVLSGASARARGAASF